MLAFAHLMKTAGTTINSILRRSFGLGHCDVHPWDKGATVFSADDFHYLKKIYSRIESLSGHELRPYSDISRVCPNLEWFTYLREPLTRTASHYQYSVQRNRKYPGQRNKKEILFEDWLCREAAHNYQTKRIAGTEDLDLAIKILKEKFLFVGLFERFDESLVMLQKKTQNRLNIFYRQKNVAPKNQIKHQLLTTTKTRKKLEQLNELDLLLYEFVKNELYPKYKCEYGPSLELDLSTFQKTNVSHNFSLNLGLQFLKRRLFYTPVLYGYRFLHGKKFW